MLLLSPFEQAIKTEINHKLAFQKNKIKYIFYINNKLF